MGGSSLASQRDPATGPDGPDNSRRVLKLMAQRAFRETHADTKFH